MFTFNHFYDIFNIFSNRTTFFNVSIDSLWLKIYLTMNKMKILVQTLACQTNCKYLEYKWDIVTSNQVDYDFPLNPKKESLRLYDVASFFIFVSYSSGQGYKSLAHL